MSTLSFIAPPTIALPSFEQEFARAKAILLGINSDYANTLTLESEPLTQTLQTLAYYGLDLLARNRDDYLNSLPQFATDEWLEREAARLGVQREAIGTDSDGATIWEDDDALRAKYYSALARFTTAGSRESYIFHAHEASANVRSATVLSPAENQIVVALLLNDDSIKDQTFADVESTLSSERVRPQGDRVSVVLTEFLDIDVVANIHCRAGIDAAALQAHAKATVENAFANRYYIGRAVYRSALVAALHVDGVEFVELPDFPTVIQPAANQTVRLASVAIEVIADA